MGRGWARLLNADTKPFDAVNFVGSWLDGSVMPRGATVVLCDCTIAALHRRFDREDESSLVKGHAVPDSVGPFFREFMTVADLYRFLGLIPRYVGNVVALGHVLSVNAGPLRPMLARTGHSGIDKRPVDGAVRVEVPEYGRSGLEDDSIGEPEDHGGHDRAVYAYAREDLDWWQAELGRPLRSGIFGENLTLVGVDVTRAVIGERWSVGPELVLEVSAPRTPCRTFAAWMERERWILTFTRRGVPGAYLRVVSPGQVRAGDAVSVVHRPDHGVTVGLAFRAIMTEAEHLPRLAAVDELAADLLASARRRVRG